MVLKTRIYTYFDTIPPHDSVGICSLCAIHDSTYQVPVIDCSGAFMSNSTNDFVTTRTIGGLTGLGGSKIVYEKMEDYITHLPAVELDKSITFKPEMLDRYGRKR